MLTNGIYLLNTQKPKGNSRRVWALFEHQLPHFLKAFPDGGNAVVFLAWEATLKNTLPKVVTKLTHPRHKILWGAPDAQSQSLLTSLGLENQLLQANLFCRDDIFKPIENSRRKLGALHIAALQPYKRHYLSRLTKPLTIIARDAASTPPPQVKQFLRVNEIEHASLNTSWVKRQELANILNQSNCLLALSQSEGGMLAATESLLCGTPLVSTKSKGGRSLWFTPNNHLMVGDNPQEVAQAVQTWQRRWDTNRVHSNLIAQTAREDLQTMRHSLSLSVKYTFGVECDLVDFETKVREKTQRFFLHRDGGYEEVNIHDNPDPR